MTTRRRWAGILATVLAGCGADATTGADGSEGGDVPGTGGDATGSGPAGGSSAGPGDTSLPGGTEDGAGTSSGPGDDGDPTGDPTPEGGDCSPLPPPTGEVIAVAPTDDLAAAIAAAPAGATLVLADGTYDVSAASYIVFATPGVTLRSQSGDPSAVVIDGGYAIGSVFEITASDVTIAEVTIQRPMYHPIHVTGGAAGNTENVAIYRVHALDPGQQAIKINASDGRYADLGTVACSHLELTASGREHVTDCYTGGIDAHLARGWVFRDNTIVGFWCAEGLSEHAVHVWNSGRDTVVERNTIVDCARGVGFGLGENGNGTSRSYDDDPCPGVGGFVGHYGGIIRNNMIVARDPALFASQFGMDSGVALEQACDATVVHNTIVATAPPFVAMEYRWPNTRATIANNLVTDDIVMRDGGSATLMGNLTGSDLSPFVDVAAGDLHLVADTAAIGAGVVLPSGLADTDFDGDPRDPMPDAGADERVP